VRLGLVPYFALGPITDISNPTASGGNQLVIGMRGMNGWLDVRGPELPDTGETPSNRGPGGGNSTHSQKCQTICSSIWYGRVAHWRGHSGTTSMPSVGTMRLAPRPCSWLSLSPSRDVDEARMLPSPPRPNCKRKYNGTERSDQHSPIHDPTIDIIVTHNCSVVT
jgi:hypothetical protein